MRIPSGVTDQYIYFVAVDSTDLKTRETGLTTFTVYRSRNGAAAAAFTTPTVNEVDATNLPGVYELLLDEDMTIGSGNDSEEMVFHITQASMAPVTRTIELYRPKITAGETLTVASGVADADAVQINSSATAAAAASTIWDFIDYGTLSGTHSSTTADLGTNAPAQDVTGQILVFPDDGISRLITSYATGTGVATWAEAVTPTLTNGDNWYLMPTPPASGADLDSIPWNAAWDTEVQSEVTDALNAYDPPTKAELDVLGTAALATAAALSTHDGKLDTVDANVDAVLVDTGTTLPATLTTIEGKVDTVDGVADAILVDTGTTIPATLTDMAGATFATGTDSLEALRNRGDAAWTTGAGGTPPQLLQSTTIATLASQTSFTLTAGSADDDAYNDAIVIVTDQSTSTQKAVGTVSDYTGATLTVTLAADPGIFTMATGDTIDIIASTGGLDAAGVRSAVGLASANLDTQLSTIDTNVDAVLVDTGTTLPASIAGLNDLDAAAVRTAIGLATANLDTQIATLATAAALATVDTVVDSIKAVTDVLPDSGALSSLATAAALATVDGIVDAILVDTGTTLPASIATVDTNVDAIKAKTDDLTFTKANELDTNPQSINGAALTGDGSATPWGPA